MKRANGQSLAEMAIVAPFLLLMLGIIIDFGYYIHDFLGTHAGLRQAAMAAMQGRGTPGAKPTPVYSASQLLTLIQSGHGPVAQIQSSEVTISYCCTGGRAYSSSIASVTRPDTAWGNADGSSTFEDTDDFVGVQILIQHVHHFLLPIYFGSGGQTTIKAQTKVYIVPGFAP
ncbi:MAG: pilus assembly protein [Candidatus Wallbacteria bacterium]|nr:pilus assembly protein [Candidatus Wallbacteria bacterium]